MEPQEYQTLYEYEDSYWWYLGLRGILLGMLRQLGMGPTHRILDAGCGTGKTLQEMQEHLAPLSIGFDISPRAATYWPKRQLTHVCVASVNTIPFRDEAFDAALCVDVLECDGVMELRAYQELWRVLRPHGFLMLLVPAFSWLMNASHHKAVHASRRYTGGQLRRFLHQLPITLVRLTYLFPTFLPVMALTRGLQGVGARFGSIRPRSDVRRLPRGINELCYGVVNAERCLLGITDFPFGSSLLAIVQKQLGARA